jgi:ferric-dicitrate binding protein FerR (iron transport regulator)
MGDAMKRNEKSILDQATQMLQSDVPDAESINASAARTAHSLGIEMSNKLLAGTIRGCDDIRDLLESYRAGSLPEARALLVRAHLHECGVCLRRLREGRQSTGLDWTAPRVADKARRHPQMWGWTLALSCVLVVSALFVYKVYWQVPPGVRAEVQSIAGSAYLIAGSGTRQLAPGAELREGDELHTAGQSHAVLRLSDGSVVEVDQRSTLGVSARGRNTTVALDQGALIVQAAHRTSGHLYLSTRDCRIAVTGTVFSVNAGIKGSRVAVLRGSVDVAHSGVHSVLHPGDQVATSDNLAPEPLAQQFAWSSDREEYVGILAQLANVEHRIAQIPFPQSRYSSDLLPRVPADTLLYISIPNLGDYLSQANAIFQDQLNQSPELQQWWARGHKGNTEDLNALVGKIHSVSQYLGDEIVIAASGETDHQGGAVVAEIQRSGLASELRQEFSSAGGGLVVLDEASLASADAPAAAVKGGFALVREHEVVFSNSIATLKEFNAQLDAGNSGFANGDFGKQIGAAYERGAGIILAANLQAMIQSGFGRAPKVAAKVRALESSGLTGVQYLIAEHREANGMPENHLNLQFAGTRQRVASWLASPAPIGSLDFVSPNASVAVATLSKDPATIADDIMEMASQSKGEKVDWSEIDAKLQISVRNDLMASLSGDFLVALDGPVLPTPSWKLVVEVNNPDRLETTLERLAQAISNQSQGTKAHAVAIEPSTVGSQRYYAIRDLTTGLVKANYTFANGFMIVAPERALLMDSLQIRASGNSLARSTSFRAMLPHDQNENYSAVAYQNLSPVITPLLSQFSGNSADAIRKLAADSRPTVICVWGKDSRIEAASDSRLFGFDFLTLGAILDSRNKSAAQIVNR